MSSPNIVLHDDLESDGALLCYTGAKLSQRYIDSRGAIELGRERKLTLEAAKRSLGLASYIGGFAEAYRVEANLELAKLDADCQLPRNCDKKLRAEDLRLSISRMLRYIEYVASVDDSLAVIAPYCANAVEVGRVRKDFGSTRAALAGLLLLIDFSPEFRSFTSVASASVSTAAPSLVVPAACSGVVDVLLEYITAHDEGTGKFVSYLLDRCPLSEVFQESVTGSHWMPDLIRFKALFAMSDVAADCLDPLSKAISVFHSYLGSVNTPAFRPSSWLGEHVTNVVHCYVPDEAYEDFQERELTAISCALLVGEEAGARYSSVLENPIFCVEKCFSRMALLQFVSELLQRGRESSRELFDALLPEELQRAENARMRRF